MRAVRQWGKRRILAPRFGQSYHHNSTPALSSLLRFLMRPSWFLSVGACAVCVGFVQAQPGQFRTPSDDSITGTPSRFQAPTLRLSAVGAIRGISDAADARTNPPALASFRRLPQLDSSEQLSRGAGELQLPSRTLLPPVALHDPSPSRRIAGDQVNKLPDEVVSRHLTQEATQRQTLPDDASHPAGRRIQDDR